MLVAIHALASVQSMPLLIYATNNHNPTGYKKECVSQRISSVVSNKHMSLA
jgi:hypothetical protein